MGGSVDTSTERLSMPPAEAPMTTRCENCRSDVSTVYPSWLFSGRSHVPPWRRLLTANQWVILREPHRSMTLLCLQDSGRQSHSQVRSERLSHQAITGEFLAGKRFQLGPEGSMKWLATSCDSLFARSHTSSNWTVPPYGLNPRRNIQTKHDVQPYVRKR